MISKPRDRPICRGFNQSLFPTNIAEKLNEFKEASILKTIPRYLLMIGFGLSLLCDAIDLNATPPASAALTDSPVANFPTTSRLLVTLPPAKPDLPRDGFYRAGHDVWLSPDGQKAAYIGVQVRWQGEYMEEMADGQYRVDFKECMVVNGVRGDFYTTIIGLAFNDQGILFSPDSSKHVYVAMNINKTGPVEKYLIFGEQATAVSGMPNGAAVFSADGKHFAYQVTKRGRQEKQFVVLDGVKQKEYDLLGKGMSFDAQDNKLKYLASNNGKWFWVIDGVEGPGVPGKTSVTLPEAAAGIDPASFMQTILSKDNLNGADAILGKKNRVTVSSDGRRSAHTVRMPDRTVCVVVDGKQEGCYKAVTRPAFTPDGRHVYYSVREGKRAEISYIVADGVPGKKYKFTDYPVFSPDGKNLAYLVKDWKEELDKTTGRPAVISEVRNFVVFNGQEGKVYDEIISPPRFSPDSKYLGYNVRKGHEIWWIAQPVAASEESKE